MYGKQIKNESIGKNKLNIQDNFSLHNNKIIELASPTSDQDAVNKLYADNINKKLTERNVVKISTRSLNDLNGCVYSSMNDEWSSVPNNISFDGVLIQPNDRILIKNSSNLKGNGVWYYDFDNAKFKRTLEQLFGGSFVMIQDGLTLKNSGWIIRQPNTNVSKGYSDIVYQEFITNKDIHDIVLKVNEENSYNNSSNNVISTGIYISNTPYLGTSIAVFIDGIKRPISYGDKTGFIWFEPSSGGSARDLEDIVSGDELFFSAVNSGFDITTNTLISIMYSA